MGDKDDYLTSYRVFFENFAATVNPEDQLPVNIAGYTITEAELPGEVIYWTTQYLTEKQCPPSLMTPLRRIILEEVRAAAKKHPNEFGYHSVESVFIALRLMQAVMARVNAVCLRYLDNSQLDSLPPPALLDRDLRTVVSATKNLRRVMEDRHVVIGNLEALFGIEATEPTSFYAVYDGHAGSAAAIYCAAHLHQYLVDSPHFQTDLRRAMQEAFLRTDEEFVRKSNQKRACGGSTAVVVVVRGKMLLASWAGDSLALLTKRMRLMQLVHPHKPNRQDERERIVSSGGTVMYFGTWRVNGQLAVSRAIGDAKYKPYVTARPENTLVELDGDEDFVVVACDGLWDYVSEDKVALTIYVQLVADPDDLKAVTKRLIAQAKQEGSPDNITVILVFLKDPRDIVAFINQLPMEPGLDNAVSSVPPFVTEAEGRKLDTDAMAIDDCGDVEADADNGVSDSDSEDFGPETAVDIDDVDDADGDQHEPAPPTPPAHAVEAGHVDGVLVDNVAESGEESEDEWNYYKGEGEPERDEQNPSEEADEPPRSDTPCQDNSAWESSSVDMNSSPLNPDAPVFVPGGVAGSDVLLAESPRKPLPMDDIELPDVAQFQTEAVIRPAELLNLDNSDQLNGHHNVSIDAATIEQINGNGKCNMDSLGFGFNVNDETDKIKHTSIIKEFDRIQKDTTDYCDIQLFQAHTETNPFDERDELFERLKNKERDPMSMSFYQEKDDDTCERFTKIGVDLNAVQPLPDSDDEDIQQNGAYEIPIQNEKENVPPEQSCLLEEDVQEPNNDILKFDDRTENVVNNVSNIDDHFVDYNINNPNNMQSYSNVEFECNNIPQDILQTDTPESHKLLFEQIPEIPDGKSSELGFTNDDLQDCSESDKDIRVVTPEDEISQDIESKSDESPIADTQTDFIEADIKDDSEREKDVQLESDSQAENSTNELILEMTVDLNHPESIEELRLQSVITDQTQAILHQIPFDKEHIQTSQEIAQTLNDFVQETEENVVLGEIVEKKTYLIENNDLENASEIEFEAECERVPIEEHDIIISKSPLPSESPAQSPIPCESLLPIVKENIPTLMLETQSPIPTDKLIGDLVATSPMPTLSPVPTDSTFEQTSPVPQDDGTPSPLPAEVPLPRESPLPNESPLPQEINCLEETLPCESTTSVNADSVVKFPLHVEESPTPEPSNTDLLIEVASCTSPLLNNDSVPPQSPIPLEETVQEKTLPIEQKAESPITYDNIAMDNNALEEFSLTTQTFEMNEEIVHGESSLPTDLSQFSESPLPTEQQLITKSPLLVEEPSCQASPLPSEEVTNEIILPVKEVHLLESLLPQESVPEPKLTVPEEPLKPTEQILANETPLLTETQIEAQSASIDIVESVESSDHLGSIPPALISQNTTEILRETEVPSVSPVPSISPVLMESTETTTSPLIDNVQQLDIEGKSTELICESRLTPQEIVQEPLVSSSVAQSEVILFETSSGPTPDLVPDERVDFPQMRNELITDIDIGIPESRAQEICVPVTSEIQHDDAVEPSAGTPSPTPVVEPAQVAPATLDIPPLSETPIAGDADSLAAVSVTAGAAAIAAVAAAVTTKAKSPAPKKSPVTPTAKTQKPAPKSATATPRTPASAVKKTAAPSPASKTLSASKPSTTKTPSNAKTTPVSKVVPKPSTPPAKPAVPISKAATKPSPAAVKEAPAVAKAAPAVGARPSVRAPAKPTNTKPTLPASKTSTTAAKPAASRPISRPATTRPAITTTAAPLAAKPKETKPKPNAPKPLANGDVKPAAKPSPKPTVTARPAAKSAPKPAPRTATAPLVGNAAASSIKPAVPRAAARAPLDKQSKDLANKRITAKAAPPRTVPAKAPLNAKSAPVKTGPKKVVLPKKDEVQENGLSNGSAPVKLPPSPPPADNALLPDVIA